MYHLHPRTSRSVVYELFERSGNTELSQRLINMNNKAHARHSKHIINTVHLIPRQPGIEGSVIGGDAAGICEYGFELAAGRPSP